MAFVLPKGFKSGDGVGMVATHVDSCCLKVRPVSKKVKGDFLREYSFLLASTLRYARRRQVESGSHGRS